MKKYVSILKFRTHPTKKGTPYTQSKQKAKKKEINKPLHFQFFRKQGTTMQLIKNKQQQVTFTFNYFRKSEQ